MRARSIGARRAPRSQLCVATAAVAARRAVAAFLRSSLIAPTRRALPRFHTQLSLGRNGWQSERVAPGGAFPARRAGATLVTTGSGAEDGWGDPATDPRASTSLINDCPLTPAANFFVRIECFLGRTQFFGHVLQVDPNARPGVKPSSHRIDEHVGWLEMRRGLRVARAPALETGKCVLLLFRAPDLDERARRYPSARRLHARRFIRLLLIVRRPGRVAQPLLCMTLGELQQAVD